MYTDFEYDGLRLSDMGYMLCQFDSIDMENISNGAQITFNTVSMNNGGYHPLGSTQYDNCLEATFQICKDTCENQGDMEMSVNDVRGLSTWLNRNQFLKFKILDDDYVDLYFEASFNIDLIKIANKIVGLELHMVTNRPFALLEPRTIMFSISQTNTKKAINDLSDYEGYIYPYMEVTIKQRGDFELRNSAETATDGGGRLTRVANCEVGEKITFDYPMIYTTNESHSTLANDFNWSFFRIVNTFNNPRNELFISLPCDIKIVYSPIVKIGI